MKRRYISLRMARHCYNHAFSIVWLDRTKLMIVLVTGVPAMRGRYVGHIMSRYNPFSNCSAWWYAVNLAMPVPNPTSNTRLNRYHIL
jgi:hypothetical protein